MIVLIGEAVESLLEGLTPGVQTEPEMLARCTSSSFPPPQLLFLFSSALLISSPLLPLPLPQVP